MLEIPDHVLTLDEIRFFTEDRIIVKALFHDMTIENLYFFHEKFLLSPAQIINSIDKLTALDIVEFDGHCLRLSPNGREWIIRNRKRIFTSDSDPYWQHPLSALQMERAQSRNGRPYKIRMKKLDHKFFEGT